MLDLKLLREHPDIIRESMQRRLARPEVIDDVLEADKAHRELVNRIEVLQAEKNATSRKVGKASPDERPALLEQAQALKAEIDALTPRVKESEESRDMLLATLPNLVHSSVPSGTSDDDNVCLKTVGDPKQISDARDHLDIARMWGVIDTERAARASGTRFAYLMGDTVWLEFALVRFVLDMLTPHGFVPVIPPVLVNREVMFGAGDLPSDEAQYYTTQDGHYLVGTSEQALAALHAEENLEGADLPIRYSAFSTCFRREAGSYGRDTRGVFRVHQFDKVEMFSFVHPDHSWEELDFLVAREEEIFQALDLPYRLMNVCSGELGAKAAKKIDIEVWFPGQGRYRELTSCSNCTDFQARRMRIFAKEADGKRFAHTLNGTGVAIQRTIAALLENGQDADGRVTLPKALHPYLPDGMTSIPR